MFLWPLAMRNDVTIEEIATITGIDLWFLARIKHIVDNELALRGGARSLAISPVSFKQIGISDKRIGELVGKTGLEIRAMRKQLGITPGIFQIDTLAAEFPSDTNYLYMTYNGHHYDVEPTNDRRRSDSRFGPYRIGSSVEFDWTSVSTVEALKKYGRQSIVINCNPETVSTDYDTSDRLYFEELTFERIADICEFEQPQGIIVSVGGQTPNNRARALQQYGFHLLGTDATKIDQAEDRNKFSHLLDTFGIRQPAWDSFSRPACINQFRRACWLSGAGATIVCAFRQCYEHLQYAGGIGAVHAGSGRRFA